MWAWVMVRRRIDGLGIEHEEEIPAADVNRWVTMELMKPGQLEALHVEVISGWPKSTSCLDRRASQTRT